MRNKVILWLLIAAIFLPGVARAATKTAATGNWNTAGTWTPSGIPSNVDSVVIPNAVTVTLDANGSCGTLNVEFGGSLTFAGNNRTVVVDNGLGLTGDVLIAGTLTFSNNNGQRLWFDGSFSATGAIISGSGTSFIRYTGSGGGTLSSSSSFKNLEMLGTGTLSLASNITLSTGITLTSGNLSTGSFKVSITNTAVGSTPGAGMVDGKVERIIPTLLADTVFFNDANTFLIPNGTQPAQLTASITSFPGSQPPNMAGGTAVSRYYSISATGLTATLRLSYLDAELGSVTEANAVLFRYADGSGWTNQGGTVNTTSNYVELAGVSTFSDWAIGDNSDPLPVQLAGINASVVNGNSVRLDWQTASEIGINGFFVERRSEEGLFAQVGDMIVAAGTTLKPQDYSFIDEHLESGVYVYRLRVEDQDGSTTYSEEITVQVSGVLLAGDHISPSQFALSQNYPNPFNPSTTIRYSLEEAGPVRLTVYNILGQSVITLVDGYQSAGQHEVTFDASSGLPSGQYVYRLTSGDRSQLMKMVLSK